MRNTVKTFLIALAMMAAATPAMADSRHDRGRDWHGRNDRHYDHRPSRSGIHISFNSGPRWPTYRPYYRPAFYPSPIVQRTVIVQQPVYQQPVYQQPVYQQVASNSNDYCREYYGPANVGGRVQQVYGTACYRPDGSWEIVD